jgi:hypothetical protein
MYGLPVVACRIFDSAANSIYFAVKSAGPRRLDVLQIETRSFAR